MIIMALEIDTVDKRILFELERNARISDVKLAKIVKKSKDAVRYRIRRLEEERIIQHWKTWIDLSKLGYTTPTIYLRLVNLPEKKQKLIDEIKKDPFVYWMGVAEGAWNIGVTYFVKSNQDLFERKNDLLARYSDLIIDCHVTSLVSVSIHEKTFLVSGKSTLLTFTEQTEHLEIDTLSKNILQELYFDSRKNIATIAGDLHTTVDMVRTRMKRLEEQKIIIRYTVALDYQKIGYEFYKALIYLKSFDKEVIESIMRYAEQSRVIINIVKQIAPWDLEFVLFARNFKEYNDSIGAFTTHFKHAVKKIDTAIMSEDIIFPCSKLPF